MSIIQLHDWSIYEVTTWFHDTAEKTIHIVGVENSYTSRVSPPIVYFDEEENGYYCRKGDCYILEGQPGKNANTEYVLEKWCHGIGKHELREITNGD